MIGLVERLFDWWVALRQPRWGFSPTLRCCRNCGMEFLSGTPGTWRVTRFRERGTGQAVDVCSVHCLERAVQTGLVTGPAS